MRRPGILPAFILAFGLGGGALGAQEGWSLGGQIHLAAPVGGESPSLREDLRGHLGSGVGLSGVYEARGGHAFRVSLDFVGTRSSAWPGEGSREDGTPELNDIWRTLRLGIDHVVPFTRDADRGPFFFYGGGVQNAWVNRTEGSLGEVTLLAALFVLTGSSNSSHYRVHGTALDGSALFATAGLGWRMNPSSCVEVRWVGAPYLRFKEEGLRTANPGPTERILGHQVILSLRVWGRS